MNKYVVCIEAGTNSNITVGKKYKVIKEVNISSLIIGERNWMYIIDDSGQSQSYYADRFKPCISDTPVIDKIRQIKQRRESLGYRW